MHVALTGVQCLSCHVVENNRRDNQNNSSVHGEKMENRARYLRHYNSLGARPAGSHFMRRKEKCFYRQIVLTNSLNI